jgi:F plasmid transfer operon, TraF, protein
MKRLLAATALTAGLSGTAMAADFQTIGTMGMGGAGVARDMGAYASYWNPAGLAFASKTFSTTIGGGVGLKVSEGLADNVDRLSKFTGGNPSTLDSLKNLNVTSANPTAVADMVSLLSVINDIQAKKGTLSLNVDAGAGFQIKQSGTGLFMLSEGYGRPLADLTNVLPSSTNGNAITPTNLITLAGTSSPTTTFFDASQKTQIDNALSASGISSTASRTNIINAIGNNLSSTPSSNRPPVTSAQATDSIVNVMVPALVAGASNNIKNNNTAVMVKNIIYTEVPISYGHAFDFGPYGKLGVGGSFKVVNGRVYQTRIRLTENGESVSSSDITNGFKDNYEQSTSVTFDLGTQWKYSELLTVGLVAKNLTSPAFRSPQLKDQKGRLVGEDGTLGGSFRDGDVKIKPQARLGVAVTPLSWLTLASDIDLTANESILSGLDFTNRHFGGGLELSPFEWFKFRGGMYENLANSDIGPVATAGLSLGIPWVLLEVDGAYGLREAKYKDSSYPREVRLQAQLAVQF